MPSRRSDKVSVESSVYAPNNQNSLTVPDKEADPLAFDKAVMALAGSPDDKPPVTTVATLDELRGLEPTAAAQIAVVTAYNPGTQSGGGVFIYDVSDKSTADDFGVNIVTAAGARWKRHLDDYRELTVLDFGAIPGGTTDTAEAVMRMWNWSQKYRPGIGIQFPAGKFMLSKFDIASQEVTRFRVAGDTVAFGSSPATTLVSDQQDGEVMFNVNARYTEITGLIVDGESTPAAKNTKGFYKNSLEAGQFIRVSDVRFYNLGGKGLSLLDTLDCKIDQWHARECSDSVIYGTWSDTPQGQWDHMTGIELSNFTLQRSKEKPAIDLQRATQSFIWNGRIEHSEFPGNLSNGEWSFRGLTIEACDRPMACHYACIDNMQVNEQGESRFDFSASGESWSAVPEEGKGNVHFENKLMRSTDRTITTL